MQNHRLTQDEAGAKIFAVEDAYTFEDNFFEGSGLFSESRLPPETGDRPGG